MNLLRYILSILTFQNFTAFKVNQQKATQIDNNQINEQAALTNYQNDTIYNHKLQGIIEKTYKINEIQQMEGHEQFVNPFIKDYSNIKDIYEENKYSTEHLKPFADLEQLLNELIEKKPEVLSEEMHKTYDIINTKLIDIVKNLTDDDALLQEFENDKNVQNLNAGNVIIDDVDNIDREIIKNINKMLKKLHNEYSKILTAIQNPEEQNEEQSGIISRGWNYLTSYIFGTKQPNTKEYVYKNNKLSVEEVKQISEDLIQKINLIEKLIDVFDDNNYKISKKNISGLKDDIEKQEKIIEDKIIEDKIISKIISKIKEDKIISKIEEDKIIEEKTIEEKTIEDKKISKIEEDFLNAYNQPQSSLFKLICFLSLSKYIFPFSKDKKISDVYNSLKAKIQNSNDNKNSSENVNNQKSMSEPSQNELIVNAKRNSESSKVKNSVNDKVNHKNNNADKTNQDVTSFYDKHETKLLICASIIALTTLVMIVYKIKAN